MTSNWQWRRRYWVSVGDDEDAGDDSDGDDGDDDDDDDDDADDDDDDDDDGGVRNIKLIEWKSERMTEPQGMRCRRSADIINKLRYEEINGRIRWMLLTTAL